MHRLAGAVHAGGGRPLQPDGQAADAVHHPLLPEAHEAVPCAEVRRPRPHAYRLLPAQGTGKFSAAASFRLRVECIGSEPVDASLVILM